MTSTTPRALEPFSPQSALARAPEIATESADFRDVLKEIGRVIVGQQVLLERLLIGLLADGHVLLEGVPGLAKTLAVRTLASTIAAGFHRIQFTPDLLHRESAGAAGADLHQPPAGGRDQPRARQGAERAAGSHAGATGHHR